MTKKPRDCSVTEDPRYHDTWCLLKKYRDVVWSLELSVQQLRKQFAAEYGSNIEYFLESIYLAGADLGGSQIESHARCIERSRKMLILLENSVELLRTRHKNGEEYYWLLYLPTFLHNSSGMSMRLLRGFDLICWTSACQPTTASGKRLFRPSARFSGDILPKTAY